MMPSACLKEALPTLAAEAAEAAEDAKATQGCFAGEPEVEGPALGADAVLDQEVKAFPAKADLLRTLRASSLPSRKVQDELPANKSRSGGDVRKPIVQNVVHAADVLSWYAAIPPHPRVLTFSLVQALVRVLLSLWCSCTNFSLPHSSPQ